jgi:hypothetical protein
MDRLVQLGTAAAILSDMLAWMTSCGAGYLGAGRIRECASRRG